MVHRRLTIGNRAPTDSSPDPPESLIVDRLHPHPIPVVGVVRMPVVLSPNWSNFDLPDHLSLPDAPPMGQLARKNS